MNPEPGQPPRLLGRGVAILLLALGVVLTLSLAWNDLEAGRQRVASDFERVADLRAAALALQQTTRLERLRAIATFLDVDDEASGPAFEQFSASMASSLEECVTWVPRVTAADRASFESALHRDLPGAVGIWTLGAGGRALPAPPRGTYFPVRWLHDHAGLPWRAGLDLATHVVLGPVLDKVTRTGAAARSAPFDLGPPSARAGQQRFAIVVPVLGRAPTPGAPRTAKGALVVVYRAGALFRDVMASLPAREQHALLFTDDRPAATAAAIAPAASAPVSPLARLTLAELRARTGTLVRAVDSLDDHVVVAYVPAGAWQATPGPVTILTLGLALTLALVLAQRQARHTLAAVQGSASRVRQVLDAVPDAIVVAGRDGRIVHASAQLASLLGHDPEVAVGQAVELLLPEPLRADHVTWRRERWDAPAVRTLGRQARDLSALHADGRAVPVEVSLTPLDFDGEPCLVASVRDARARRTAEARAQLLFASSPLPSWVYDLETLRFLAVNEAAVRKYGWSRDEFLAMTLLDIRPAEDHARLRSDVEHRPARFQVSQGWRHTLEDGTLIDVQISSQEIEYEGRPAAMVVVLDVTEQLRAERALREAEERFSKVFRASPHAVLVSTLDDGQILDANPAYCELSGYAREELVGRRTMDLRLIVSPLGRDLFLRTLRDEGVVRALEMEMRCKGDRRRTVILSAQPIEIQGRQAIVSTLTDVTEQRRMEAALREAESRYRDIVENTSEIIHTVDPDSGRFQFVNRAWLKLMGYDSVDEARQVRLFDALAPEWVPVVRARLEHLMRGESVRGVEVELCTREGRRVLLEGSIVPRIVDGRTVALQAVLRDVSERRRRDLLRRVGYEVARALSESSMLEEALPRVLEALCRGLDWCYGDVHLAEPGGGLRPVAWWHDETPEMRRFCQHNSGTLSVGADSPVARLLAGRGTQWIAEIVPATERARRALECGLASRVAVTLVSEARTLGVLFLFARQGRPLEPDATGLLDDVGAELGQFVARALAQQELRAERNLLAQRVQERTAELRRLNTDLERAGRLKDEFLAAMSHELRTPLNAILGLSEALRELVYGPVTPRQAQALETVQESGRHLLELINDILDLSKIEAGRVALNPERVELRALCESSLRLVREAALHKQLALDFWVAPPELELQADSRRLKQVLVNLLSNAVKFTPAEGRVWLEARREQDRVRIVVGDTGIGIAPEDLGRLFQPFVQLDSRLAREHEGTGLGLALVRRLVELHGGEVSLESQPGAGTRVTVELPWEPAAPVEPPARGPAARAQHVLIVEDDPSTEEQLRRYLEEGGRRVSVIQDGLGAARAALELDPDAILLDLLLPGASGWEVLEALRADARLSGIPILVVSVVDERAHALAAGAADTLVKPVDRGSLLAAVDRLPARRRVQPVAAPAAPLVLLAEDNEAASGAERDYLEAHGLRVILARHGGEAVELALEHRPAVILMDVQMPGMDGLEATRRLRARPELADVPIVAVTALAMPGDRERCLEAGADQYLTKPVALARLLETVRALLR